MMGFGTLLAYTPTVKGNLFIGVNATAHHATSLGQIIANFRYGTGSAPANGAGVTGTALMASASGFMQSPAAAEYESISSTWVIKGLTVSTAYWFDFSCQGDGTGAASITVLSASILES